MGRPHPSVAQLRRGGGTVGFAVGGTVVLAGVESGPGRRGKRVAARPGAPSRRVGGTVGLPPSASLRLPCRPSARCARCGLPAGVLVELGGAAGVCSRATCFCDLDPGSRWPAPTVFVGEMLRQLFTARRSGGRAVVPGPPAPVPHAPTHRPPPFFVASFPRGPSRAPPWTSAPPSTSAPPQRRGAGGSGEAPPPPGPTGPVRRRRPVPREALTATTLAVSERESDRLTHTLPAITPPGTHPGRRRSSSPICRNLEGLAPSRASSMSGPVPGTGSDSLRAGLATLPKCGTSTPREVVAF